MRIEFTDEDGQLHLVQGVKVIEVDELKAAFKMLNTHLMRTARKMFVGGVAAQKIDIWSGLDSVTIQAIQALLRMARIKKPWTDFSADDLATLLVDDLTTNTQSIIGKANGFSFTSNKGEDNKEKDHETVLGEYITALLFCLGGGLENFATAINICKMLTVDDLNYVLTRLSEMRGDSTASETKGMLEIEDESITKLLTELGFGKEI